MQIVLSFTPEEVQGYLLLSEGVLQSLKRFKSGLKVRCQTMPCLYINSRSYLVGISKYRDDASNFV
jgi:hypothetical protein